MGGSLRIRSSNFKVVLIQSVQCRLREAGSPTLGVPKRDGRKKGGLRLTATENGEKNGEGIKSGITEIALRQLHGASPLQGIKVIEAYCFFRNMVKFCPARKYVFSTKNA